MLTATSHAKLRPAAQGRQLVRVGLNHSDESTALVVPRPGEQELRVRGAWADLHLDTDGRPPRFGDGAIRHPCKPAQTRQLHHPHPGRNARADGRPVQAPGWNVTTRDRLPKPHPAVCWEGIGSFRAMCAGVMERQE